MTLPGSGFAYIAILSVGGNGHKLREHASSPKYIFVERGVSYRTGQLKTASAVSRLMFSQISKAQFRPMQD